MFKSLLIFYCPWINVTLDFVIDLFINNSYNAILITINYLIKKRHYILDIINKNGTITKATTKLLFHNIKKLHNFLIFLISNKVF